MVAVLDRVIFGKHRTYRLRCDQRRNLRHTKMAETLLDDARKRRSEALTENEELKNRIKTLTDHGPQWARNQLMHLKSDNAHLRREVAELTAMTKLPPDLHKRFLASCRRWRAKKQAELNLQRRSLEERERTVGARTGTFDDRLWADLMKCLHTDGRPSKETLERAFIGLKEREEVLRAKAS